MSKTEVQKAPESSNGIEDIADEDASQLAKQREEKSKKVKRKFQAIREKLAQDQDRRSRP